MASSGYAKLRRGIIEHLQSGRMTADEYAVYSVMILLADWQTGEWVGSAGQLASIFHWSVRQCQRLLKSLRKKGYTSGECGLPGSGPYRIKVERYFQGVGATGESHPCDSPVAVVRPPSRTSTTGEAASLEVREEYKNPPLASLAAPVPGFELFWEAYPKKIGKPAAYRAWLRHVQADDRWPEVLEGLERWKKFSGWDDEQFIPHAAKFLEEARWRDHPVEGSTKRDRQIERTIRESVELAREYGIGEDRLEMGDFAGRALQPQRKSLPRGKENLH